MTATKWVAIPTMQSPDVDVTLTFWELLGFRRTYHQKAPYQYGAVERNGCDLHFYNIPKMIRQDPYNGGCLIIVKEVVQLHKEFSQILKTAYNRVPVSGTPRISRMKPGQTRFTVTDITGNSIIFIKRGREDNDAYHDADKENLTSLQRAIANAMRFRNLKEDDKAAAKVLDFTLKRDDKSNSIDRSQALFIRLELSIAMNDMENKQKCIIALKDITLTEDEIVMLTKRMKTDEDLKPYFKR